MAKLRNPERLLTAVLAGKESTTRRLLKSGKYDAYIKQHGGKLLFECTSPDIARLLILEGANVNAVRKDGKTLLNKAASPGDAKMMHFLLSHGATKWNDCVAGRKFFRRLFANCLLSSKLSGMFKPFLEPN
jgi:ankyrin repeat protein